jgi:hypothetical protein
MYFIVASGVVAVVPHHRDERAAAESTSPAEMEAIDGALRLVLGLD